MRDFNVDGVLVGRPYQTVHEQSATQYYPVGMIYEAFGKRWRYFKAAANITIARRGCPNLSQNPWDAGGYSFGCDSCLATGVLGENYVIVTLGADYDNVSRTVDCFQGGILTMYPPAPREDEIFQYHILGNDASYNGSGTAHDTIKIYLDPPPQESWTDVPVDGMPSPYMFVGASGSGTANTSVIVVPEIQVTNEYYFWGQTRGPAWVTPTAGWNDADHRMARWHTDGTIQAALDDSGEAYQVAGYLLAENSDSDDAHIMLMLE
jgi:hypothetical protein